MENCFRLCMYIISFRSLFETRRPHLVIRRDAVITQLLLHVLNDQKANSTLGPSPAIGWLAAILS